MAIVFEWGDAKRYAVYLLFGIGIAGLSCSTTPPSSSDGLTSQQTESLLKTGDVEQLYEHANERFDSRDYLTAFRFYRAVVDRQPNHLGALVNLGVCARRLGDVDGAVEWYDRALAVEPNDPTALQDRVVAGLLLGRVDESIPFARRLTTLSPDDPTLWQQLASLYIQTGQFGDATSALHNAVSLDDTNSHYHFQLGVALAASDEYAAADESFARALQLNPDLREAYPLHVQMLMYLERYDDAWSAVAEGQTRGAIFDPDLILELQRLSGQVGPR